MLLQCTHSNAQGAPRCLIHQHRCHRKLPDAACTGEQRCNDNGEQHRDHLHRSGTVLRILGLICRLQAACERAGKGISVHVKLNTGMNRFGAEERDFSALFSAFEAAPLVRPTGVFSHLAAPEDEAFTALQRERFDRMTERLAERCPGLTRHLSASGGFLKGLFYDMVRIGILLYGYAPFPAAFAVRPAMRVSAPVSACRYVEEGEGILRPPAKKRERVSFRRPVRVCRRTPAQRRHFSLYGRFRGGKTHENRFFYGYFK